MPLVNPDMNRTFKRLTGRHCSPLLTGFLIRALLVAAVLSPHPPSQATLGIVTVLMALHAVGLKLSRGRPTLSGALAVVADLGLLLGMTTPNSLLAPWMILTGLTLSLANLVDQRPRAAIFVVASLILLAAHPAYHAPIAFAPTLLAPWGLIMTALSLRLRHQQQHATSRALNDELTGLGSSVALAQAIRYFGPYQQRNHTPFTLAALCIHFQEPLSHRMRSMLGKRTQRQLAHLLETRLRRCDVPARIGENQFALLLTDCDLNGADRVLSEIRAAFQAWTENTGLNAQLTIGACSLPDAPFSTPALLQAIFSTLATRAPPSPGSLPTQFFQAERIMERLTP